MSDSKKLEIRKELKFTGERYLPGIIGDIEIEHYHRYLLAQRFAEGKDILDIACGEGYGTSILARFSNTVTGVDIDSDTILQAKKKYLNKNVNFVQGNCSKIPFLDNSFDLIVSFETIEHHDEHDNMIAELRRVLKQDGLLLISSPDKKEYSDIPNYQNEFHVKELYKEDLEKLLRRWFENVQFLGQKLEYGSFIVPIENPRVGEFEYFTRHETLAGTYRPLYFIVLAGNINSTLPMSVYDIPVDESEVVVRLSETINEIHADKNTQIRHLQFLLQEKEEFKNRQIRELQYQIKNDQSIQKKRLENLLHELDQSKDMCKKLRFSDDNKSNLILELEEKLNEQEEKKNKEIRYLNWRIEQIDLSIAEERKRIVNRVDKRVSQLLNSGAEKLKSIIQRIKIVIRICYGVSLMFVINPKRFVLTINRKRISNALYKLQTDPHLFYEGIRHYVSLFKNDGTSFNNRPLLINPNHSNKYFPKVSIIIINFNGQDLLEDLLPSILDTDYPDFEIVIVDNGSDDSSVKWVKDNFPKIKLVPLKENIGFAEANNIAVELVDGEVLCLLNNDMKVDRNWLKPLVQILNSSSNIGAVGSKILFWTKFIPVSFEVQCESRMFLIMERMRAQYTKYPKFFFDERFGCQFTHDEYGDVRNIVNGFTFWIPWISPTHEITVVVGAGELDATVIISTCEEKKIVDLAGKESTEIKFQIDTEVMDRHARWIINNAGSVSDSVGEVYDRGFGQPDIGQYDESEEVSAICGGAVAIRRDALGDRPVFWGEFFAYFEDTELSERLKESGYTLAYCPESIVYHKHATTSQENSDFFQYYVTRNKLLFQVLTQPKKVWEQRYISELQRLNHLKTVVNTLSSTEQKFVGKVDEITDEWKRLIPLIENGQIWNRETFFPKIAVYNNFWSTLGGGEYHAAVIASCLQEYGPVDLLSEIDFEISDIEVQFDLDLKYCRKRIVTSEKLHFDASITKSYDVFINSTYGSDLSCYAKESYYIVSFPYRLDRPLEKGSFLETYNCFLANSNFTKKWVDLWWSKNCEVLYPAVPYNIDSNVTKQKIILNVGRFFWHGHNKKQFELVKLFKQMIDSQEIKDDWRLVLVGQVQEGHENYLKKVIESAQGYPIEVYSNVSRTTLTQLYDQAALYWHATGLGEDLESFPEKAEHFGITTVEAMMRGAVPVVIKSGGQPEIVSHGKNGYLFSNEQELIDGTKCVVSIFEDSSNKYREMSNKSRLSVKKFSKDGIKERFLGILKQNGSNLTEGDIDLLL